MHRRDFIRSSLLAAAGSGTLFGMPGTLRLAQAALPKGLPDFKALVCVFLHGGNDSFNTIVPRDSATHATYASARGGNLVIARDVAAQLPLAPLSAPDGGGEYGLHPSLGDLHPLFDSGDCAIVANVGPLLYPTSKAELEAGSVPTPPQLFSHSDQAVHWQTSWPDASERNGWLGRVADAMVEANDNRQLSTCISLDGANTLQVGRVMQPYFMSATGSESVFFIANEWQQQRRDAFSALRELARGNDAHPFERAYGGIMQRALDTHALVSAALEATPAPATEFPESWLGAQLAMVAQMIAARSALGMSRQIYYVSHGGYDTHDNQLEQQATLLAELGAALSAFHAATVELGVANDVTAFTASEFGRTVSVNGDGTDHGWGGHHFVLGGAVQGRRIYGRMPQLAVGGPDDAGWGQIIPTTAVDQYAATLVRWFGVPAAELEAVLPNLGRFAVADLGFMS